jgi:hypothetical protein
MGNSFTFFGEQMDAGGRIIGYGPIMTFTGGTPTNKWGASTANTLEDITTHDVIKSVKENRKMTLMISGLKNFHQFKFEEKKSVHRFTLKIMDGGRIIKLIYFPKMTAGPIIPVELVDKVIQGHRHELSKASYNTVALSIEDPDAIQIVNP